MKAIFMIHLSVVYLWERRGKIDGDVVFRFGLENLQTSSDSYGKVSTIYGERRESKNTNFKFSFIY